MNLLPQLRLIIIIISLIVTKTNQESNITSFQIVSKTIACNFENWCNGVLQGPKCCISVANINTDLANFLNECIPDDCSKNIENLRISSSELSKDTLNQGWLTGFQRPIIRLYIHKCELKELGAGVFSEEILQSLEELELIDLKDLTSLKKNTFQGTSAILNRFSISYINPYGRLNFEAKCFEGLESVTSFQLIRCIKDPAMLHNISGENAAMLGSVQIFDLQANQFIKVEDFSFKNFPQLQSLYLHHSTLTEIEPKAFWSLFQIQSIHIKNNQLTYLPPDVFRYKNPKIGQIYAESNYWDCNCDLKWFIDYALSKANLVNNGANIMCADGQLFSEVDLSRCPDSTTISTTTCEDSEECEKTTPSPSSSHGTTPIKYLRSITCTGAKYEPPLVVPIMIETFSTITINLIGEDFTISCDDLNNEDEDELANIEVGIEGQSDNIYLLLFLSRNNKEYVCNSNLQERNSLNGLLRNKDYTLCLMANTGQTSIPFQCLGFKLQPAWRERAWITNKYQALTVGLFCLILIILIIITTVVVFFVMRQNPSLLKGNKRVIIVDTKTTDAIVMPKDYNEDQYKAPSYVSEDQGYIHTRSAHSYAQVDYFKPPVLRIRDSDDCSMANVTYASTIPSNEDGVSVRRRSGSIAPPLPPPNRVDAIDLNYDEICRIEDYSTV